MRLVRRLWLWGAVVPVVAVAAALIVAVQVFRVVMERALDEALLSQAATESVSLFDAPDGRPHLHVEASPLAGEVRAFVPATRLYGPDGALLAAFPAEPAPAARLLPQPGPTSRLETRTSRVGARLRVLTVQVRAPDGAPHVLQLVASLASVDQAVRTFSATALALALLLGGVLLGIQGWQARVLSRRLRGITEQIARAREGDAAEPPPEDEPRDEIAEVRLALRDASVRLQAARAAQEALIARAAHELRTPLALMRTGLDLALRRERSAAELRGALEENRREVDRLATVADALLELSAAGGAAVDLQPGDLRPLLEESAAAAAAEAEQHGVRLAVCGAGAAPCRFDAHAVRRAVDNLVSNALRFAPRGTEVRLELTRRGEDWEVAVQDAGKGIPAAHREDVFLPFHRLEKDARGVGLGLSIVREVAHAHGGRAWVAEPAGPGARVAFSLPAR